MDLEDESTDVRDRVGYIQINRISLEVKKVRFLLSLIIYIQFGSRYFKELNQIRQKCENWLLIYGKLGFYYISDF